MLIAFGDSNTTGFGLTDLRYSWMAIAAQGLGSTWVSIGTNAATLQFVDNYNNLHDKRYLFWEAIDAHPYSTGVIYPGTADIVYAQSNSAYDPAEYDVQLHQIVAGVHPDRLVLIEPNSVVNADINLVAAYQQVTREIAQYYGVAFIETAELMPTDGIHHNATAQATIGQRVAAAVKLRK